MKEILIIVSSVITISIILYLVMNKLYQKNNDMLFKMPSKPMYYILNFTWGTIYTLIGLIVALMMKIMNKKFIKYKYGYMIEVGNVDYGINFGIFSLVPSGSENMSYLRNHEFGHSIQNCYFGIFNIFIVSLPSVIRFWYRKIFAKKIHTSYYDIWFERTASNSGEQEIIK